MDETVAELRRTAADLCEDARIAREFSREQRLVTRALVKEMKDAREVMARSRTGTIPVGGDGIRGRGNRA